jgi:Zn-finger nucleic acid-binding protein
MLCFKCKNEMQKTIFEGTLIDYCSECKGFWLDKEEFDNAVNGKKFDSEVLVQESNNERLQEIKQIEWVGEDICVKCKNGRMNKILLFNIEVDECQTCKGLFFDKDELKKCYDRAKNGFVSKIWAHIKNLF